MIALVNVFVLNIKLFASQWARLLGFLLLMFVLGGVGWLAMNHFSTDNAIHPVGVAIVDHDNSLETMLILQTITEAEEYTGLIEFLIMDADSARDKLYADAVAAVITFPEDFGLAMTTGENLPFSVVYSPNRPLASSFIHIVAGAFADMLEASQTGVYTTLNFAREADITSAQFDMVFWGVNLQFLGMIMNRQAVFDVQAVETSSAPLLLQYGFTGFLLGLLSVFLVLMQPTSQMFSPHMVSQHRRVMVVLVGTWLAYVSLLLMLSGLIVGVLYAWGMRALLAHVPWVYLPALCMAVALIGCFFIFAFRHDMGRNLGLIALVLIILFTSDFNLWRSIATEPIGVAMLRFVLFAVGSFVAVKRRARL